eukprot:221680_1
MRSTILNELAKIENKGRNEYIQKTNLRKEIEMVLKSFFYANRTHLPENPYPEITKRFRQIEVRVRRQKQANILDNLINENKFAFSCLTVTTQLPIKLFNMTILSSSRINKNDKSLTIYGLKHVINGISDIYWIESIYFILSPILCSVKTTMDQCILTKISLISSPIFFSDSYESLVQLSTQHILYTHLFPEKKQSKNVRIWPYFICNKEIDIYNYVG